MKWTEGSVAAFLVRHTFNRRILAVPNCNWPGNECDLLVVAPCLRLIDVEIKLDRSDLLADAKKEKWWHARNWWGKDPPPREPRDWPPRVWKHYYCLPEAVWRGGEAAGLPENSGILMIREARNGQPYLVVARRVKANRDAKRITERDCIDIARLAGLRMWDAYAQLDRIVSVEARHG